MAAVWRETLGRDRVGRDEDFFLLGGDSLLALRTCLRLEHLLGRPVPVTSFFEHATVAGLARFLAGAGDRPEEAGEARARLRRERAGGAAAERRLGHRAQGRDDEPL